MLLSRRRPWRKVLPRKQAGPLRCVFIITSMPVGGAETLLVNMMRRMDPETVCPEVVCLKERGPLGSRIASDFPVHAGLLTGKWDLRVLPRLVGLLHRRRADVVVTVGAGDKMFWGRLAAHLAGVPVIASALHSTGWPDGIGRLNRMLTSITDTFIAVADSHGEFLRTVERLPDHKVRIIRNGVDCQTFRPSAEAREGIRRELGLATSTQLVGMVAALRREKNHALLVRAAARIRRQFPETHWLIVGDGPQRASIETLAGELGIRDRIHLLGTREDIPRIVAALDVFALCSLSEASPVSVLEALACEVPVVATDVGSLKESVIDGTTGFLVPSNDVDALSASVQTLLADPAAGRTLGAAGRQLVRDRGSLQSMVDGYQRMMFDLYDARVADGGNVPGPVPLRRHPSFASDLGRPRRAR